MSRLAIACILALILPFAEAARAQVIDTTATHAVILDYDTGEVLFSKNGSEPMIPASMTKIMTAHVVFERLRIGEIAPTDRLTVSEDAWRRGGWASGGSTMGLAIDDRPTVEELLRGVIILSGNDACIVLAEGLSGSEDAFALEMTEMAQSLGLGSANFENATGLYGEGHRISAADLARLARIHIMEFPDRYGLYAEPAYEWRGIGQANRNPLLGTFGGVDGLKTGHLEISGYGLVASAEREGVRRIVVINGLASEAERAVESERLMRMAFQAFDTRELSPDGVSLPELEIWMGEQARLPVRLGETIRVSAHKRAFANARSEIIYDGPLEAPVGAGDPVAEFVVTLDGREPIRVPVVAVESVGRLGLIGRALEGLAGMIEGEG